MAESETIEMQAPIQRSPQSGLESLNQLPWERIVTAGIVFLVLYILRDFFLSASLRS